MQHPIHTMSSVPFCINNITTEIESPLSGHFVWIITTHKCFIINIAIHNGYVSYSDECTDNAIRIFIGGCSVSKNISEHGEMHAALCGYFLLETVYLKYPKNPFCKFLDMHMESPS